MEKAGFLLSAQLSVMSRTCIANSYDLVRNSMLTVCSASVDSMDVVDAATNGILLDDSDTHGVWLMVSMYRVGLIGSGSLPVPV